MTVTPIADEDAGFFNCLSVEPDVLKQLWKETLV